MYIYYKYMHFGTDHCAGGGGGGGELPSQKKKRRREGDGREVGEHILGYYDSYT